MRLFISIQAAMILIACCICGVVTSKQSDAGFIGEKNYEEVVKMGSEMCIRDRRSFKSVS